MKPNLFTSVLLAYILFYSGKQASAQFIADSSKTYFVCNAAGVQSNVSAFGDANGGTYSFWIDKRNGTAGSAIYGQHLDSLGVPIWSSNGKMFYQEKAKEVWLMKAVAWQNGILVSWVQGGFGIGGDTLFCNYYNADGVSQWTEPAVIANKQGNIIYVGIDNMEVYPNDFGATFTFGLTYSGGNNYLSFNHIDFSGKLQWPLDNFAYQGNGYYYQTGYDNHNGFYVATSTGGLGAHIYMGHFDLKGNLTIPVPVDVCGTAGGRGNSQWKVICDAAGNAYIVWASYTKGDISMTKIKPDGTLAWSDAKQICSATGAQEYPDAIINKDTIYAIWDDSRPGSLGNFDIYMQKLDTAGNSLWTTNGILLSHLNSYIPYPKLVVAGNNIVAAYEVNNGFRGQQIQPDSSISWKQNGVSVNVKNMPFYGDYQLTASINGGVTAIWSEGENNICAARVRPGETFTSIAERKEKSLQIFPNPARDNIFISGNCLNGSTISFKIFNASGNQIFFSDEKNLSGNFSKTISVNNFQSGVYTIRIQAPDFMETKKVIVVK